MEEGDGGGGGGDERPAGANKLFLEEVEKGAREGKERKAEKEGKTPPLHSASVGRKEKGDGKSRRATCLLVGEIEKKKKVVVRWRGKCGEGKYFLCGVGGGGVGEDGDGK